jgi:hypothetical protein
MAENSQTLAKLWFGKASHDIGIAKLLIDEKSPCVFTAGSLN